VQTIKSAGLKQVVVNIFNVIFLMALSL
jgi:hypothetical protein